MSFVDLVTPGMFISDLQRGAAISFCAWIALGLLVGLIGSKLVNKTGHGLVRDVLLSIFGAIVAGFLSNLLGESHTAGLDFYSLLVATVGAVVSARVMVTAALLPAETLPAASLAQA